MSPSPSFFFFNDTATTEIYTLSLHDALPIFHDFQQFLLIVGLLALLIAGIGILNAMQSILAMRDRKSTRLNSSHSSISYAVFCLKKKTRSRYTSCSTSSTYLISSPYFLMCRS